MELEAITRQEQIIAGKDLQPVTRMEFFLKTYGGGGSGGGVQPDWNQNDSTAADYVKNRPIYSETKEIVIENVTNAPLEGFPAFAVGDTVTVKVDGVEHSLIAQDNGKGFAFIGDNPETLFGGTGEFGWVIGDGRFIAIEAHTVSYLGEVVHKLNAKYLPESVFKIDGEILIDEGNGTYTLPYGIEYGISMLGKRFVALNHLVYINEASADSVPVFLTDYNYKTDGSLSCSVTCLLLAADGTYTAVNGELDINRTT